MKGFDNLNTAILILAVSTLVLGACSPQPKTTSTTSSYSVDQFGNTVKTTVTKEVQAAQEGAQTKALPPQTSEIDVDCEDEVVDNEAEEALVPQPSNVRVHAPFVNVEADDGKVHVRAPFVRIDKNGHGDRTTIRIPGITIRGE